MKRLFYRGRLAERIVIEGRDAHHLTHVLRARIGDRYFVTDDYGASAKMEIEKFGEGVTFRLVEMEKGSEAKTRLTLAACLLKGDKFDFVLQKGAELGVSEVFPLVSRNTVVKVGEGARRKEERFRRIAEEAAKQCGRSDLMKVSPILTLEDFLAIKREEPLLFCYENEEERSIKEAIRDIKGNAATLLIGPEGGFTLEEATSIGKRGGRSITLGRRILRAETAAIFAAGVFMYEKEL